MEEVKLRLDDKKHGAFYITDGEEQLGEMVMDIRGNKMTVYHTEVDPKVEGKGYAKKMLGSMVAYAREHHLKVDPLCPYVHAQFNRHPEEFADIMEGKK